MKKIYAISTGPGDPELLTVKAARILSSVDVVFAPNNRGKNMALDSARAYIKDAKIIMLDYPMGAVDDDIYKLNMNIIEENIPGGGSGAFVNIGDNTIYSTSFRTFEFKSSNIEIEFIPGIPSFLAGANELKLPLVKKSESFVLTDDLSEDDLKYDSIAILKTYKNKKDIIDKLKDFDIYYLSNISSDNQKILTDVDEILEEENYMSLIIARRKGV